MIVNPGERERCRCKQVECVVPDGPPLTVVLELELQCPVHSFPNDKWPANARLWKYAHYIDLVTGTTHPLHEARAIYNRLAEEIEAADWPPRFEARFRLERPTETEARLLAELAA